MCLLSRRKVAVAFLGSFSVPAERSSGFWIQPTSPPGTDVPGGGVGGGAETQSELGAPPRAALNSFPCAFSSRKGLKIDRGRSLVSWSLYGRAHRRRKVGSGPRSLFDWVARD